MLKNVSTSFENLPDEVLLEIFSYLSLEDLASSVQHVNIRWKEISLDDSLWKDATFEPGKTMSSEEVAQMLENMPALKSFSTTSETKIKLITESLHNSQAQIQRLDLHRTQTLSLSCLKRLLEIFPNIENLNLPLPKQMSLQLKWAHVLGQCDSLVSLSFDNCHGYVVHGMLKPIAEGCQSLKHIYLGHCEFSPEDVNYLLERKKHQLLSFSTKFLHKSVFAHLSKCSKLEYLHVENSCNSLTSNEVKPLMKLQNIKSFTLQYCTASVAECLPFFFLYGSFSKLVSLDLSHNFSIQDSELEKILTNFPLLQHLNLSNNHILEDEGLQNIWRCPQLEFLNISRCCGMTDKCLKYASKGCKKLKELNISLCHNMTDNAIQSVLKFSKLQILKLGFKNLTGAYFNLISIYLRQLKELHIDYSNSFNREVIHSLQQEMPRLKIMYPFYLENTDTDYKDTSFSPMN